MRADARALDLRLQERRDGQAFRRGFDRSLLNAWAGAGYQSYFLRDRSGGHGVSPVGDSEDSGILDPRSEMQGMIETGWRRVENVDVTQRVRPDMCCSSRPM